MATPYTKEWAQSHGVVISVPSEKWAESYGGPQCPKLFIENYNNTGDGINVTWTTQVPPPPTLEIVIYVRGNSSGCYVQSTVMSNISMPWVGPDGVIHFPIITTVAEGVVVVTDSGSPIYT